MQFLPRSFLIFAFCIPLAVIFGIMLATPLDRTSLTILGIGFLLLLTPVMLTNHHGFLILTCNAYINAFFLPGQPFIWLVATAVSCFFSILTRTLNRGKMPYLSVRSISIPLIILFVVTLVTANLTGGVGSQATGSNVYGARRYFYLWFSIAAYFAISSIPMPENKRRFYAAGLFLTGITSAFSNVAYMLGKNFYFMFLLFPAEYALGQYVGDAGITDITRISGLGPASLGVICWLFCLYGLSGCFSPRHIWRLLLLTGAVVAGLLSGFRSVPVFLAMLVGVLFVAEGLYKSRQGAFLLAGMTLCALLVLPFADRLPLSIQRCLTVLPLDLDRVALEEARGSTQWRLDIWRAMVPEIPKYLMVGKGYAIDPKDLYFASEAYRLGVQSMYETAIVAGDYHSGPLTVIIPFGLWGALAFIWFCASSIRVLWRNYRYSDPAMKILNTFLFSYFIAKLLFFCTIFGSFFTDLIMFVAPVAVSISINRGVLAPVTAPVVKPALKPSLSPLTPPGSFQPA